MIDDVRHAIDEITRLTARVDSYKSRVGKLVSENTALRKETQEYARQIIDLEEEIGQLKTGLAIAETRAALSPVQAAPSLWRPIETAPKDETRVLLFVPPYGPTTGHRGSVSGAWRCHSVLNQEVQPTHWMPLPPPPEKGGE
jgi:FtsZ-binding cell division protein ZapB